MSDLRDAARQALNSLRGYRREISCEKPCDAERALEAALKQPEQEPVAHTDDVEELLEALKEMLKVWEEDPAYGAMHADKARAAIARAEGKV
jgi:Sec-independent protein translocase protein TatA